MLSTPVFQFDRTKRARSVLSTPVFALDRTKTARSVPSISPGYIASRQEASWARLFCRAFILPKFHFTPKRM